MLLDGAEVAEVVEGGARVCPLGGEAGQLRHYEQRHLTLQRQSLAAPQHQREVLVLARTHHAGRCGNELQVIEDDEAELAQRVETLRHGFEVLGGERQHRERQPAQPHRRGADAGAGLVAQHPCPAAQLVHGDAALDGERALHEPLLVHLPRQIRDADALLRHTQREAEGKGGLPRAHVPAERDQVAPPEAPSQELVERGEARGNGVSRDLPRSLVVHALDDRLQRGPLLEPPRAHAYKCMRAERAAIATASAASAPSTSRAGATS